MFIESANVVDNAIEIPGIHFYTIVSWLLLMQFILPAWPPREPSYLSGLETGGPSWLFLAFIGFLWPLLTQSIPPWLTTMRTTLSKWTRAWKSPLVCFWPVLMPHLITMRTILSKWTQPQWFPLASTQISPWVPPWAFILNYRFCLFDIACSVLLFH
jgi:hypothetical protein